ncbi:MAG TPA: hypothetical protein DDY52_03245 [Candidatus Moranbacteria bacterium]|nr:hypothetical protein [Candidatus Moranbacteria bacterium]
MQKKWYQSWTIWFNVGLFAIATINELSTIIPISTTILANVAITGNILLRFKTTVEIVLSER